jgi:hypothetical protein
MEPEGTTTTNNNNNTSNNNNNNRHHHNYRRRLYLYGEKIVSTSCSQLLIDWAGRCERTPCSIAMATNGCFRFRKQACGLHSSLSRC